MARKLTTIATAFAAVALLVPASAAAAEDEARVEQAIDAGPVAVEELVAESATDYSLANAILEQATVTTETTGVPTALASTLGRASASSALAAAAAAKCHGPVSSKTTISILGVNLGWRRAIVNSWCWNSARVTSWSVTHDEWSGFGYCWKSESATNTWLIYPTRLKYRNKGTLAGVAPWGCSGGQQTIAPSVHYERYGGWNVYAND